ncbi:MAG: hypothetical protein WEA61_05170 [Anaerolineales bacterium]
MTPPTEIRVETVVAGTQIPTATNSFSIAEMDKDATGIADIRFIQPGAGSSLVSPIHLIVKIPSDARMAGIDLRGRDGRLLARSLLAPDGSGQLELDIDFEISRPTEAARLLISIEDEFDRLRELASLEIKLLASGESTILPPDEQGEIIIEAPSVGDSVGGGAVLVSGNVRGLEARPLNVQLITRSGRVLASDDVYPRIDGSGSASFAIDMDYRIDGGEWVLVSVSQQLDGVTFFLESVEVWLES